MISITVRISLSIVLRTRYSKTCNIVQRVRKTALHIARSIPPTPAYANGPDLLVVELAALLHDVRDKKYTTSDTEDTPTVLHSLFSSVASVGGIDLITDGRSHLISRIVDNVSWSTEKKLLESGQLEEWHETCLELHCVQDADRLDAIGAFGESAVCWRISVTDDQLSIILGIMRCAAYNAASNR